MPNNYPRDRIFNLHLTTIKYSYIPTLGYPKRTNRKRNKEQILTGKNGKRNLQRSLQKRKLVLEQKKHHRANTKYLILESSARNACNMSRIFTMCSYILTDRRYPSGNSMVISFYYVIRCNGTFVHVKLTFSAKECKLSLAHMLTEYHVTVTTLGKYISRRHLKRTA